MRSVANRLGVKAPWVRIPFFPFAWQMVFIYKCFNRSGVSGRELKEQSWIAVATSKEATHSTVNCVGLFGTDSRKDDYYSNNSGIGVIGSIGKPKGIGSNPICHNFKFWKEIEIL